MMENERDGKNCVCLCVCVCVRACVCEGEIVSECL